MIVLALSLTDCRPHRAEFFSLTAEYTMKAIASLFTAALALSACTSLTGPDARDAAKRAELARRNLEVASKVPQPSMRLSAN